jgi:iron-regulated transporter 1
VTGSILRMYQPVEPMTPTSSTGVNDERRPLLATNDETSPESQETPQWTLTDTTRRLYVSHFLSTCNSRVFEFGSVLYLASIFPGTLLPMSVYAMVRGAAAILLSSLVGQYIDREDRLKVVRLSIGNIHP